MMPLNIPSRAAPLTRLPNKSAARQSIADRRSRLVYLRELRPTTIYPIGISAMPGTRIRLHVVRMFLLPLCDPRYHPGLITSVVASPCCPTRLDVSCWHYASSSSFSGAAMALGVRHAA